MLKDSKDKDFTTKLALLFILVIVVSMVKKRQFNVQHVYKIINRTWTVH